MKQKRNCKTILQSVKKIVIYHDQSGNLLSTKEYFTDLLTVSSDNRYFPDMQWERQRERRIQNTIKYDLASRSGKSLLKLKKSQVSPKKAWTPK